jgi:hypothetical protein
VTDYLMVSALLIVLMALAMPTIVQLNRMLKPVESRTGAEKSENGTLERISGGPRAGE